MFLVRIELIDGTKILISKIKKIKNLPETRIKMIIALTHHLTPLPQLLPMQIILLERDRAPLPNSKRWSKNCNRRTRSKSQMHHRCTHHVEAKLGVLLGTPKSAVKALKGLT